MSNSFDQNSNFHQENEFNQTTEASAWGLMSSSLLISIAGIITSFVFPPALPVLLAFNLGLNFLKFSFNSKEMIENKKLRQADLAVATIESIGIVVLLSIKFLAIHFPLTGILIAGLVGLTETVRFGHHIRQLVKIHDQVKNFSSAEHAKSSPQIKLLEFEREKLRMASLKSAMNIGFTVTIVAFAVASIFVPPLVFVSLAVLAISALANKIFDRFTNRKLKKLAEIVESPNNVKPNPLEDPPLQQHQDKPELQAEIKKDKTSELHHDPKILKSFNHSVINSLRQNTNLTHLYLRVSGEIPSEKLVDFSSKLDFILYEIKQLFPDIQHLEHRFGTIIVTLKDDYTFRLSRAKVKTNGAENVDLVKRIAILLKNIGWDEVRLGQQGMLDSMRPMVKTMAEQAKLIVLEDEPPLAPEDIPEEHPDLHH